MSADWLAGITGADVGDDVVRPGIAARGVRVALPGHTIEFVQPAEDGLTQEFLAKSGERIHSVSYAVKDLDTARDHLRSLGVEVKPGSDEHALFIDPGATEGALFELAAER